MSKTNWTHVVTIVLAVANAVVPFMPAAVEAVVVVLLQALATIFHVSDVQTAAAAAPKSQQ